MLPFYYHKNYIFSKTYANVNISMLIIGFTILFPTYSVSLLFLRVPMGGKSFI